VELPLKNVGKNLHGFWILPTVWSLIFLSRLDFPRFFSANILAHTLLIALPVRQKKGGSDEVRE